jgi:hypothetical protein
MEKTISYVDALGRVHELVSLHRHFLPSFYRGTRKADNVRISLHMTSIRLEGKQCITNESIAELKSFLKEE